MTGTARTMKLSEIAELNPSLTDALEDDDQVSFVPMSAVDAETATTPDAEIRSYGEVSKGYTPFLNGDVLVAKITPCFENGKIAQARLTSRVGFGSTEFHVVRPFTDQADARYLLYYLRQERIRRDGERKMTGSAGQRRVPQHFLADLVVPVPPLSEQLRIAEVLDRAHALRTKRRATLATLDTLTQSIFLDIFGDPATNPKRWQTASLEEISLSGSEGLKRGPFGGALKKEIFVKSGYKVYEQQHAIYKDCEAGRYFISEPKYLSMQGFAVQPGDFIVSCSGTVGRIFQLPKSAPKGVINQALLRIRINEAKVAPVFFETLFESTGFQRSLLGSARGTGIENFPPMERIRSIETMTPPLHVQNDFARRVTVVEKLKAVQRASLAALDALFTSLQHRAFQGEL